MIEYSVLVPGIGASVEVLGYPQTSLALLSNAFQIFAYLESIYYKGARYGDCIDSCRDNYFLPMALIMAPGTPFHILSNAYWTTVMM